ncbi:hypothetical protein GCWU000342_00846 [Shuttleworthella satelles DSM 14600]|uniref:Uncharacterized protein n=1 Tax=Shuttleworthella satelles DSM 14600 TaxID=626523 RepID=C4GA34_9FIRM|nr:hypothetical protein GCWU000342_00846 [Shuttleworthia satelles DSM 14600]
MSLVFGRKRLFFSDESMGLEMCWREGKWEDLVVVNESEHNISEKRQVLRKARKINVDRAFAL